MIGLNEELAARAAAGKPVKIGMIGAGQMGVDVVAQVGMMKGIDVVVVADIDTKRAQDAYRIGMLKGEVVEAKSAKEADKAVAAGKRVFTTDYRVVTDMKQVDVMLESDRRARGGGQGGPSLGADRPATGDDERRDRRHGGPAAVLVCAAQGLAVRPGGRR